MKHAFLREYETKRALAEFILQADKLSMDAKCAEFENKFATYHGRAHGILFNSGGSANLAMLQALRNLGQLQASDKVGFSALTWSTNVMPIIQMGLEAVPVDVEPATLNVMAHNLEERIKETPLKALFITNALGLCGDLDKIKTLCEERGIILLEDNCEALGTKLCHGRLTGCYGVAASSSFFVAHHMSTIEGGMVITDDDTLAEMLRIVRANGWDRNLTARQQAKWRKQFNISSEFEAKYTFYDLGYNLRPTEITGFLGLYQMQFLDENIALRERHHLRLEAVIKENPDLLPLDHAHIKTLSSFATSVIVKDQAQRAAYLADFAGAGIEIRPMIAGNMQLQPFYSKYVGKTYHLPGAQKLHDHGFYCGNYPELTEADLQILESCLVKK